MLGTRELTSSETVDGFIFLFLYCGTLWCEVTAEVYGSRCGYRLMGKND